MLVFLAHWCPHCNDEIPVLNEWRDAGGVPEDLRIVGVSTAVASDRPNFPPGEWLVDKDWTWDVIADGPPATQRRRATAYGVTGFPFFVLLDADGNVAARGSGEQPIEYIEELVATVTELTRSPIGVLAAVGVSAATLCCRQHSDRQSGRDQRRAAASAWAKDLAQRSSERCGGGGGVVVFDLDPRR